MEIPGILLETTGISVENRQVFINSSFPEDIPPEPGRMALEFWWISLGLIGLKSRQVYTGIPLGFQWNTSGNQMEILSRLWWKTLELRWNFHWESTIIFSWVHSLLHPIMIPCFHSGSPKSLGNYFLSLHDLKERVRVYLYVKMSCNHKISDSFTIIISYN